MCPTPGLCAGLTRVRRTGETTYSCGVRSIRRSHTGRSGPRTLPLLRGRCRIEPHGIGSDARSQDAGAGGGEGGGAYSREVGVHGERVVLTGGFGAGWAGEAGLWYPTIRRSVRRGPAA